jgi:hypothetical protein
MKRKILIVLVLVVLVVSAGWTQERQLKRYTTYQTALTNDDIMKSFVGEVRTYLQRYDSFGCYYFVDYEVYQEKEKQNYAWGTETYENKYQWGTVYTIYLFISNARLWVKFCNTSFTSNGQDAHKIVTTRAETVGGNQIRQHIISISTSLLNESKMVLKMYNDSYSQASIDAFGVNILSLLIY